MSRFAEEPVIGLLKQAVAGRPMAERCRQAGITGTRFHSRRSNTANLEAPELLRLRQVETMSQRLKGQVPCWPWPPGAKEMLGRKLPGPRFVARPCN